MKSEYTFLNDISPVFSPGGYRGNGGRLDLMGDNTVQQVHQVRDGANRTIGEQELLINVSTERLKWRSMVWHMRENTFC